ncbi:MAG: outer membrane beta-barrel protein [Deltaproteobacteria bacterium]
MDRIIFTIVFISLLSFGYDSLAQSYNLKLLVRSEDQLIIPGAAVRISKQEGTKPIFQMTDPNGQAIFSQLSKGFYSLKITHIGYKTVDSLIELKETSSSINIAMQIESVALGEVSIVGKKPLIRQEDDKMIIDPAPIAATASNTLEVLESTPGMYVDQEGGIFLNGATPASIYINGREQKMSTQDIQTMLRNLPPNSVEKIEVMRIPSSKFDAASSGGIINIVLKRGVKLGRFGSVNAGVNHSKYFRQSMGLSFNNSGNKSTTYINLNYNLYQGGEQLTTERFLGNNTSIGQSADIKVRHIPIMLGYGMNYEFNPRINFNYDGRISFTDRKNNSDNENLFNSEGNSIISESLNRTSSTSENWNIQQDLGLTVKFDTSGSELSNKLSLNFMNYNSDQNYMLEFLKPQKTSFSGYGNNAQNRFNFVFESDLIYKIFWQLKLEAGLKSSVQNFGSNSEYFISLDTVSVLDPSKTNSYKYLENINAAYLQLSREVFAGINIKTGLRFENTYMKGNQSVPSDTSFIVNRNDLFPYLYISRKVFNAMGIELFAFLIYRKTISRPGYNALNPYAQFVDQFLYESGNPSLRPQFTDNFEFNLSFNDMPVFAIGRNVTKNIFSSVMYNDKNLPDVLVRTYDNVGTSKELYFRGIIGIPPGSKYFFALGAQYNFNEYDGIYQNSPWQFSKGSWRFFTFHSLNITKDLKFSVTGFMMTNGQWNFYEMKNFGQLNIGLTQTLLNKKLTITVNARDILKTMDTDFSFNQGSIKSVGKRVSDTRWFGLNIRYNFGLNKKEEKKSMPAFEVPEF